MNQFDFSRLYERDREIASQFIGSLYRPPDLVIAPDGHGEYMFRWYIVPRNPDANVYFHIQTQSDPERPLHDHPWDSTSVILAGGYNEVIDTTPETGGQPTYNVRRYPGDVIFRPLHWAHRLTLPSNIPYSMSLFLTGPKEREWGFWDSGKFMPFGQVTQERDGRSSWKGKP